MNTIAVNAWRGLVVEVYASDPDTTVTIVDKNADECTDDIDVPTHQAY